MISAIVSTFLAHYGLLISFVTGLVSKTSLASVYAKIKSVFTSVETDVKKVV